MTSKKRKSIIDDGMNPEQITPFSICHRDANYSSNAVGFYEMDVNFSEILILQYTHFHQYDDWTTFKKGGKH